MKARVKSQGVRVKAMVVRVKMLARARVQMLEMAITCSSSRKMEGSGKFCSTHFEERVRVVCEFLLRIHDKVTDVLVVLVLAHSKVRA